MPIPSVSKLDTILNYANSPGHALRVSHSASEPPHGGVDGINHQDCKNAQNQSCALIPAALLCYGRALQRRRGNKNPIVIHIAAMLEALNDMPLRAVYMVVRQLYLLQQASRDETPQQE